MGRGRIRVGYIDLPKGGINASNLKKDASFSAASLPNADPAVFRELKAAVSKVASRIGIDLPQSNLGFVNKGSFIGVEFGSGDQRTVLLNKLFFDKKFSEVVATKLRAYKTRWSVPTNAPAQHTLIHELGHSIWVDFIEGRDARLTGLNNGIRDLYTSFRKEVARGRLPVSQYATANINEFFAELFTKSMIGKAQNRYSKKLLSLLRQNRELLLKIR